MQRVGAELLIIRPYVTDSCIPHSAKGNQASAEYTENEPECGKFNESTGTGIHLMFQRIGNSVETIERDEENQRQAESVDA